MSYPPPVTRIEHGVLEIIARGHPQRHLHVKHPRAHGQVNALSWEEIQIASGLSAEEFADCIAHLVAGNLIDSADSKPGLWSRMRGQREQVFFWATSVGRQFLIDNSLESVPGKSTRPTKNALTADTISDAIRVYENTFSVRPYVKPQEAIWASEVLDDDIKLEVGRAGEELSAMWSRFEKLFGHRNGASNEQEKAVRDPVVIRTAVRTIRAEDEQLRRKGFPPSAKPESWNSHYKGGDVGLEPAPWEDCNEA